MIEQPVLDYTGMVEKTAEILGDKSLVLILAYVPTGLGHLRVTDALYHGLPENTTPLLLGSQDITLQFGHRVMSVHPWGRKILDFLQNGPSERLVAFLYRSFLRFHAKLLYEQLVTILDQRIVLPKTVLVVSTHFGLGHQLVYLKKELKKRKNVDLRVVIVVTDDSPQVIWYVPGADLTFVPSHQTKEKLLALGKESGFAAIPIEVVPYPVSGNLTQDLSEERGKRRLRTLSPIGTPVVQVAIPVSGAAVGLDFFTTLIDRLHKLSARFRFSVVARSALYTKPFLEKLGEKDFVKIYSSVYDREVVNLYEELYDKEDIALEVTKPSEQAFKALINPCQTGGVILLFSTPVGRQEYENLDFLRRHSLLPEAVTRDYLFKKALQGESLSRESDGVEISGQAYKWRSLEIPEHPLAAANFIDWCLKEGIFAKMVNCRVRPLPNDPHPDELGSDGVARIWERVASLLVAKFARQ